LELLPAQIEKLEKNQAEWVEKMAAPSFYQGDGKEVARATSELTRIESELKAAYARWEELLEMGAST
jgi:ATP-binding cassette subfamily F protein uup